MIKKILFLTILSVFDSSAQPFVRESAVLSPEPESNSSFEFIDVDGDEDLDILSFYPHPTVSSAFRIRIYENLNRLFQGIDNPVIVGGNIAATSFVLGDGNSDGHTDILYVENGTIWIATNLGDKTFSTTDLNISVAAPKAPLYWIDADADLDLDIITKLTASRFTLLLNENGTYERRRDFASGIMAMTFGDFLSEVGPPFGDGPVELLTRMKDGTTAIWVLGLHDYYPTIPLAGPNLSPDLKAIWTNIDSDRDIDLLALTADGKWALFENVQDQKGVWTLQFRFEFAQTNAAIAVGDLNNDNLEDIVLSGNGTTTLYTNTSEVPTISFHQSDLGIVASDVSSIHMVNIDDSSGLGFLFRTTSNDGSIVVNDFYLNTMGPSPLVDVPSELSTTNLGGGRLKLEWWGPGTYFRLEIIKDGVPVVSSESLPSGKIRRPGRSPLISSFFSYEIRNATPGVYKWRVQAVNAAQRATAFSAFKEIDLPASAPLQFKVLPVLPITEMGTMRWVDVDKDGDMDCLVFFENERVELYENVGGSFRILDNVFSNSANISTGSYSLADGIPDNFIDFVFEEDEKIKIAKNNGNRTFTILETGINVSWGENQYDLYWIDLDGDGDLDIVTQPTGTNYVAYLNGTIGPSGDVTYPVEYTSLSFADLNNDSLMDFFFLNGTTAKIVVATSPTTGVIYLLPGTFLKGDISPLWLDFDQDGDIDLLVKDHSGERKVFRNQFADAGLPHLLLSGLIPFDYNGAGIGDFNSDGSPDLIIRTPYLLRQIFSLYINQSTTKSTSFLQVPTSIISTFGGAYVVDLDKKNGLDMVSGPVALMNTLQDLSPPPQAPFGLTESISNGVMTLSWVSAGPGKTYRVEVYKDGLPYISSMSGDNQLYYYFMNPEVRGTSVRYSNITEGNYSWRVQAVDASFRASTFSASNTFTIAAAVEPPPPSVPVVTNIQEFRVLNSLHAYPNPARNFFSVEVRVPGKLTVSNSLGQMLKQINCNPEEQSTVGVSTEGWSEGIYTIVLDTGTGKVVGKVAVVRN